MELTDVLIVGAGPAGLTLACQLARAGVAVRVIDRKTGRSVNSKALGLQYRVSELLDCMGVADRFFAEGGSPSTVNIYSQHRRLVSLRFRPPDGVSGRGAFEPRPILIPQADTERILAARLEELGVRIQWGIEFTGFEEHGDLVVARIQDAKGGRDAIPCRWLVSAEGAHSVARKQAGLDFDGKQYPMSFVMADVVLDTNLDRQTNHVWMHAEGSTAVLPFRAANTWRLFIETTRELKGSITPTLDEIEALLRARTGRQDWRIEEATWIAPFSIHARLVTRYRSGRLFLVGDAAHIHSPTGGQGIATGVQDAANLAWKLVRVIRGAPRALLDTYDEERRPCAAEVLAETDRTTQMFFAPTLAWRLLRDWLVLPLLRSEAVQRRMFSKLAQLHVNYRKSSISIHRDGRWWAGSRLRAGDRAPDVLLRHLETGEITTLFRLLGTMRPIALLSTDGPTPARVHSLREFHARLRSREIAAFELVRTGSWSRLGGPCVVDVHDEFRGLYGMEGEFICLIRPDGHIGLFQRPVRVEEAIAYVDRLSSPESLAAVDSGTPIEMTAG